MTPGVVTVENALEIFADDYRRLLTNEAREYADKGLPARDDFGVPISYWDSVVISHRRLLWLDAYEKRKARLARIANNPASTRGVPK